MPTPLEGARESPLPHLRPPGSASGSEKFRSGEIAHAALLLPVGSVSIYPSEPRLNSKFVSPSIEFNQRPKLSSARVRLAVNVELVDDLFHLPRLRRASESVVAPSPPVLQQHVAGDTACLCRRGGSSNLRVLAHYEDSFIFPIR